MQGLTVDRQALAARLRHRLDALAGRDVDEVHAGSGRPGEGHRPAEGQELGELGVDQVEVRPLHPALLAEALVVELDEVLVLAVHHHDPARLGHLLHGEVDAAEVDAVARAFRMRRQHVGGEHLEARVSRLDRLADLVEDPDRERARERHVKGVVDVGVALPAARALLDHRLDVQTGPHVREVDVGGGASAGHPPGVLLGPEGGRRLLGMRHDAVGEVRVGLDAAGGDDLPGRVDDARGLGGQRPRRSHHRDLLTAHAHVPLPHALRRDDLPVADHEVEHDRSLAQVAQAVKRIRSTSRAHHASAGRRRCQAVARS